MIQIAQKKTAAVVKLVCKPVLKSVSRYPTTMKDLDIHP